MHSSNLYLVDSIDIEGRPTWRNLFINQIFHSAVYYCLPKKVYQPLSLILSLFLHFPNKRVQISWNIIHEYARLYMHPSYSSIHRYYGSIIKRDRLSTIGFLSSFVQ